MSAQVIFPLCVWKHDPSGQPMDYTIELPLDPLDVLVAATVTAVDDNDAELVGDSLLINVVTFGLISGSLWGVTFDATFGEPGTVYKLRCRYTLDDGRGSDRTVRLACLNT